MLIETAGILLAISPYGEYGNIATIYLQNCGIYKGFWQLNQRKHTGFNWGIGSSVMATWKAGNEDALGKFNLELIQSLPATILTNSTRLLILNATIELVTAKVPERIDIPIIYQFLDSYCRQSSLSHDILPTLAAYLLFKLQLLQELGFALEIHQCCHCNNTNAVLSYISPKSGRAVCNQCAAPYKNKLLGLPAFLLTNNPHACSNVSITPQDIHIGFQLLQYFYQQRLEYQSFFEKLLIHNF